MRFDNCMVEVIGMNFDVNKEFCVLPLFYTIVVCIIYGKFIIFESALFTFLREHVRDTSDLSIDSRELHWYNYFMCGYRGILEHEGMTKSQGLKMMMHGIVPPGAGLSSSSAFVCCAAMTTMYGNKKSLPKV